MATTKLYKLNHRNDLAVWTIRRVDEHLIEMTSANNPGDKPKVYHEVIKEGKAGRTLDEQVESRIAIRIKNKLDTGYCRTPEDAKIAKGTFGDSVPLPMLAQAKQPKTEWQHTFMQPKLDGMRVIIVQREGRIMGFSRKGQEVLTISHIYKQLEPLFKRYPDIVLDGELYEHGTSLQTIMSWAKRRQADTTNLQYHIFDIVAEMPFGDRLAAMKSLSCHYSEQITNVPSVLLGQEYATVDEFFTMCRESGFEGAILRNGAAVYQPGKRSKDLIKVKEFADDEFYCKSTSVTERGVPTLILTTNAGKEFSVTAWGAHEERAGNAALAVNQMVTVKYAGLTPYGIPFHPVALGLAGH